MGNTTTLGNKSKFRELLDSFGLPRLIIACFLLLLLIAAPCVGLDFPTQITNIITRFSWNAVMVLAMVPMVHSGCGLNFGLPLGIVSGLLGATLSIELGYTGFASFLMAILIATPFALLFGGGYGWLLNKIKGGEMMIATYVGFSSVSFMCMMWLLLPYKNPLMLWGSAERGCGRRSVSKGSGSPFWMTSSRSGSGSTSSSRPARFSCSRSGASSCGPSSGRKRGPR